MGEFGGIFVFVVPDGGRGDLVGLVAEVEGDDAEDAAGFEDASCFDEESAIRVALEMFP